MAFELDERLAADCAVVGELPLCRVLMMKDRRYPWCILVPRIADVTEIYQLSNEQQQQLQQESVLVGKGLMAEFGGHKLNVAALGNVVSQLHVHHVVRFTTDETWPGPVWGIGSAEAYSPEALAETLTRIRAKLADALISLPG